MYNDDEDTSTSTYNFYKLLKTKRKVKNQLWEDYKSLNISNGYTPIETEDFDGDYSSKKEDD